MNKTKTVRTASAIAVAAIVVSAISYGLYRWLGLTAVIIYLAVMVIAFVWMLYEMKHAIKVNE